MVASQSQRQVGPKFITMKKQQRRVKQNDALVLLSEEAAKTVLLRLGQANQPPRDNFSHLAVQVIAAWSPCVKSSVKQLRRSSTTRTSLGALDGASHPEGEDK